MSHYQQHLLQLSRDEASRAEAFLADIREVATDPPVPQFVLQRSERLDHLWATIVVTRTGIWDGRDRFKVLRWARRAAGIKNPPMVSGRLLQQKDSHARRILVAYEACVTGTVRALEELAATNPEMFTKKLPQIRVGTEKVRTPAELADALAENFDDVTPREHEQIIQWCRMVGDDAESHLRAQPRERQIGDLEDATFDLLGADAPSPVDSYQERHDYEHLVHEFAGLAAVASSSEIRHASKHLKEQLDAERQRIHQYAKASAAAREASTGGGVVVPTAMSFGSYSPGSLLAISTLFLVPAGAAQAVRSRNLRSLVRVDGEIRREDRLVGRVFARAYDRALTEPVDQTLARLRSERGEVPMELMDLGARVKVAHASAIAERCDFDPLDSVAPVDLLRVVDAIDADSRFQQARADYDAAVRANAAERTQEADAARGPRRDGPDQTGPTAPRFRRRGRNEERSVAPRRGGSRRHPGPDSGPSAGLRRPGPIS